MDNFSFYGININVEEIIELENNHFITLNETTDSGISSIH